jgi:hypothetical protein
MQEAEIHLFAAKDRLITRTPLMLHPNPAEFTFVVHTPLGEPSEVGAHVETIILQHCDRGVLRRRTRCRNTCRCAGLGRLDQ